MAKYITIFLLILIAVNTLSQPQPYYFTDTIKIQQINILAKKPLKEVAKTKLTIDTTVLQQISSESMAELLSKHSQVFIKQAGRGALATVSFRGTSASHTDVLWNGVSIKSPMLGQVDFSLIPNYFIDEVELLAGGSSMETSSGALGGSISIGNKNEQGNEQKVKFVQTIGSYSTFSEFLQVNLGKKKIKSKTRLLYSYSKNDFEFKNKNNADIDEQTGEYINKTQKNENAEYLQYGLLQEIYYSTGANTNLSAKYWGQYTNRNLPRLNTYEGDDYSNINNQVDQSHRVVASAKYYSNRNKFEYSPAFVYQKLDYWQKNYIGIGYRSMVFSKSATKSIYNKFKFRHSFNNESELSLKFDFNIDDVSTIDTVSRLGYNKRRKEYIFFVSYNKRLGKRFAASVIAQKYFSDNTNMPISPFVGFEYAVSKKHNINAKINISKNYKYPSLNDLYWQPGGNIDLKPEDNLSTDFGIVIDEKVKGVEVKSGITAFYSDVKNWIIWLPSPMGYWTPRNIKSVIAKGAEFHVKMNFSIKNFHFVTIANYSYTNTKNFGNKETWGDESYGKQLPYVPLHSANIFVSISRNGYNISYTHNSYSERFTSSSNSIELRDWLYPYFMNNLLVGKKFAVKKCSFKVDFKIYNLFNEKYRSVLGRPMPGTNYLLSLKLVI